MTTRDPSAERAGALRPGARTLSGVLVLLLSAVPLPAAAQGLLDQADSLAAEGQAGLAREALGRWWAEEEAKASRAERQRGLWLRAALTTDAAEAAVDYRRLVVEYPGGTFSDRALLRLAQAGLAGDDPEGARQHLATLLRDYPQSPLRVEARALLDGVEETDVDGDGTVAGAPPAAAPEPGRPVDRELEERELAAARGAAVPGLTSDAQDPPAPAAPPAPSAEPVRPAGWSEAGAKPAPEHRAAEPHPGERPDPAGEPEGAGGVDRTADPQPAEPFEPAARTEPVAQPEPRSAPDPAAGDAAPLPPPGEAAPPSPTPAPDAVHAVQLGAFSTAERAEALAEAIRARGLEPRLVRVAGNELVRVRLGSFRERADAADLRGFLQEVGFDAMIVSDVDRERPLP